MEGTGTSHATSHATWWGTGAAGCALVVLVLSFRPWFTLEAAQKGADLVGVLAVQETAWSSVLGAIAVVSAVLGGALAVLPLTAHRGLYVWPSIVGAVLAPVRLALPPDTTLLGENLAYARTLWAAAAVVFVVAGALCAVLCASLRNQERLG